MREPELHDRATAAGAPEPVAEQQQAAAKEEETAAEMVPETIAEMVSEPAADMVPETTAEMVPETAAEMVPETAAEMVPEPAVKKEEEPGPQTAEWSDTAEQSSRDPEEDRPRAEEKLWYIQSAMNMVRDACRWHGSPAGCKNESCRRLHLCSFLLAGICNFGNGCRRGHSLDTYHNQMVCERYGTSSWGAEQEIIQQLRTAFQAGRLLPEAIYRSRLERCFRFGLGMPCDGNVCKRLHICSDFVSGNCTVGACEFRHDLHTSHNSNVLNRHKMADMSDADVLKLLREKSGLSAQQGGRGQHETSPQQQVGPRPALATPSRDVRLRDSENAWRPRRRARPGDLDDEVKVIKAFRGILNKLTHTNLDQMFGDIKKLELNTESRLHKMVTTLFDMAVNEPFYADLYAIVCVSMSKVEVGCKTSNFRKLLLTQCQRAFESVRTSDLKRQEQMQETVSEMDQDAKKRLQDKHDQECVQMRRRSNGNGRFIGELYKLSMLTDRIIHQCIVKLVKDKHEDSYECLCELMTTVGQKLEKAEQGRGKDLSQIFHDFNKLARDKTLQSRIRCKLLDLVDTRSNGWVSPRATDQRAARPTAIEEVRRQARQQRETSDWRRHDHSSDEHWRRHDHSSDELWRRHDRSSDEPYLGGSRARAIRLIAGDPVGRGARSGGLGPDGAHRGDRPLARPGLTATAGGADERRMREVVRLFCEEFVGSKDSGGFGDQAAAGGPCGTGARRREPSQTAGDDEQDGGLAAELQCPICLGLLDRATALGCGHTFCAVCLEAVRQADPKCPLCRGRIASSTRVVALDNIVKSLPKPKTDD